MSASCAVLGAKSCCLKNVALLCIFLNFVVMLNMQGRNFSLNTNLHKEEKHNKIDLNMPVPVFYNQMIHYRLQPKYVQRQELRCGYMGYYVFIPTPLTCKM